MDIHKDVRIADLVALFPESEAILKEYGLHCTGCAYNGLDTLAEGMHMHGYGDTEIMEMLVTLQELLLTSSHYPQTLTVTTAAAHTLQEMLRREGKIELSLLVTLDEHGGFCMEFVDLPPSGALRFGNREAPDIHVYALPLTLRKIGGSTIDVREGKFKLDLPHESCGCTKDAGNCCKN